MKRPYYPLDLSALAYPMMQSRRTQSNFRFSATLKEAVDPDRLLRALTLVIEHYPNLKTEIVPSFFWHKMRVNDAPLLVKEDDRPPLSPLRREDTNGYPFRLAYKGNEIVLEVFHAATDGDVGALFLSDLLTCYVSLKKGYQAPPAFHGSQLRMEDAFITNAKKKRLRKVALGNYNGTGAIALGKAGNYRTTPILLSEEIRVADLKASAKSWGATVTEYVAACYVAAILETVPQPLRKPLCLFVPVNLRRFFPSDTLQNFVCFERITLAKGERDLTFERVLTLVREQFRTKITEENMQRHVDDVNLCFTLPFVKYFPLFIKKPCFKFIKKILDKVRQTAILSNVGTLPLPPETAEYVADVKFFLNIGKNTPLNVAVVSYGDLCHLDITCGLKESGIPARFFALLTDQGKK
ncbi:MAG: hypothetical protein IJT69_02540 [Clostridia bacterium]|nr:hypothetical protein [Clostridia bacterium]